MTSYTIEDIELIRRKSGISYQEAVALLDYHNGNVARALIDLERNGRIKPEQETSSSATSKEHGGHRRNGGLSALASKLYRFRLKVRKGDTVILNLSMLFSILAVLVSPHLVIAGAIIALILGYRISFDRNDSAFAAENLERMVRNAAQNVKSSVSDMARGFSDAMDSKQPDAEASEPKAEGEGDGRSFYQSNPAATTYHAAYTGSAPTLQVPVQVESQDGSVKIDSDKDGYNNATIE